PKPFTHSPSGHHTPGEIGCLLNVVFGPGSFGAIDHFLSGPSSHDVDDSGAEVRFGVVVAITFGPLISHSQGLPPRYNGYPIDRIGAGYHQAQDGMASFVISNPLTVMMAQQQGPFRTQDNFFQGIHKVSLHDAVLLPPGGHQG